MKFTRVASFAAGFFFLPTIIFDANAQIAISANDADALVPVLKKAMERGITVISWDSGVAKEGRQLHLNPSDTGLSDQVALPDHYALNTPQGRVEVGALSPIIGE